MKDLIIIGLIIIGIIVWTAISIDFQKTECLESGGKWVTGMVLNHYSALCIPK
jgi:hypothetical protein